MPPSIGREELERLGVPSEAAEFLADRVNASLRTGRGESDPDEQVRRWLDLRAVLMSRPELRWNFELHRRLFGLSYAPRGAQDSPAPAWVPAREAQETNIGLLMAELGADTYEDLHRWSVEHREAFWEAAITKLGTVFRRKPDRILAEPHDPARPDWLPGASLNIAESCFQSHPDKVAVVGGIEGSTEPSRLTYGELRRLAARVANGLDALGVGRGGRVALYMPMTAESIAIYLGTVLAGRAVVGIADASAPSELERRVRIGGAKALFTVDSYVRDGKEQRIYEKVVQARAPRAVVLARPSDEGARLERTQDIAWDDFLGSDSFDAIPCRPSDLTNVLFSSGTTKDPKAIPWTHVTPIKAASDAYFHHDVRPSDVLAWPTSFGWMMGPWLTYASLVNRATMALYVGAPQRREFGEFVERAGVTILGVVPKLVRSWKADHAMEGLDWSRIRLFSSTAEPSTPVEMLYLMFLAGYKPIVEYCGGTEIGGGYVTGTVVQPSAPSTFSTPALGIDFGILDEGRPVTRGEVFLHPPSIGLSNDLLNYDHFQEYYAGLPRGPNGELLRRHGDQLERLSGGYYRHHGRVDDMININGVKTSAEEVRSVLSHDLAYDAKPIAVDVDGSGQASLVLYVVPRDLGHVDSRDVRERLRRDFERAIKEKLNPLLAHVHDVVLVSELPQAGPGKTRTMKDLREDYLARRRTT